MSVLVDAHAHFHPEFEPEPFLDAALRNFQKAWQELPAGHADASVTPTWVLLLADPHGQDSLARLREGIEEASSPWSLRLASGGGAVVARREGHPSIVLLKGSQVATRERLEVLALACTEAFPVDAPFETVLSQAVAVDAVAVVPWGFGKWMGSRGRTVRAALESRMPGTFFLGDNGGRLAGTPTPRLIRFGSSSGFLNLPGSDPLPFGGEHERIGSRGFVLAEDLDLDEPLQGMRRLLRVTRRQPPTFGTGVGALDFAVSQMRMQVRNRFPGS